LKEAAMDLDLDTFLVTVYCLVDDLYEEKFAARKPKRRGKAPRFSDSEVLTVALLAQWHPSRSERALLRQADVCWRSYFPDLPSQSWLNRRIRDLSGALGSLGPAVYERSRQLLGRGAAYEVLDSTPAPLMKRCRGARGRLFGEEAAIGRGGSDREWYYGLKVLGAVSQDGFITGFVAGKASTEDRWMAECLLRWRANMHAPQPAAEDLASALGPSHRNLGKRLGPEGPLWPRTGVGAHPHVPYIADLGFAGREWKRHWSESYGVKVLTKADYAHLRSQTDREKWEAWLSGLRQKVEITFSILHETFGLRYPKAKTLWGLKARLSAKVAAYNIAVLVNCLFNRPPLSLFTPWG